MTAKENLYYAIGSLAYAVAAADGEVQKEERKKFLDIINNELVDEEGYSVTGEIIFKLLDKKEKPDVKSTYDMALETIRNNGHYLSPELKSHFIAVLEKVAAAYPPVTAAENAIVKQFKADIEPIKGDPVYYSTAQKNL